MKKLLVFLLIVGVVVGTGYYINNYQKTDNEEIGDVKITYVESDTTSSNSAQPEKISSVLDCHLYRDREKIGMDARVEDIIKIAENNPECTYTAIYAGHNDEMSLYDIKKRARLDSFEFSINDDGSISCVVAFK